MMAYYTPCHNCAHDRNECATRERVRSAIAGLSVTSIKFRCPDRAPLYRVGDRVTVTWVVPECDDVWGEAGEESWPATVIEERGARYVICVDDVDSDNGTPARSYVKNATLYCKVSASKLKPLDEPKRSVCQLSGLTSDSDLTGCWQTGTVPDKRCLREITRHTDQRERSA